MTASTVPDIENSGGTAWSALQILSLRAVTASFVSREFHESVRRACR
jgi:hypothetical protein